MRLRAAAALRPLSSSIPLPLPFLVSNPNPTLTLTPTFSLLRHSPSPSSSSSPSIFAGKLSTSFNTALRRTPGNRVSAMSTGAGEEEQNRDGPVESALSPSGEEQETHDGPVESPLSPSEKEKESHDGPVESSSEEEQESHHGPFEFALSPSTTLKIQKGDITRWFIDGSSDAIVNAANERMLGGGGVDGAIHRAAGPELREACYKVPQVHPGVRCPTGEARITPGFKLPASHVIHTVGPIYDDDENPEALLTDAYRNSLLVAKENNIQYIAFPAISCGVYGYPYDEAASIAISTIKEFANDFKEVHFVLFLDEIYEAWLEKAEEILGK